METTAKIVALGDSITYGFPYTPQDSWVHLLEEKIGAELINRGICGDTTGGMAARFRRDVLRDQPSAVILLGGANDILNYLTVESVMDHLKDLIHMADASGIQPILALPTPCDYAEEERELAMLRDQIRRLAIDKSMLLIDFFQPLAATNGKFQRGLSIDGIHPSREGYRMMALAAEKILQPLFGVV